MTPEEEAAIRRIRKAIGELQDMSREAARPVSRPEKIERALDAAEEVRKRREAWRKK